MKGQSLTFDDHDVTPVHGEPEILERVHARGTALRRRKVFARAASGGTVVALLLAGGIAIAYQGGGPNHSSGLVNPAVSGSVSPTDTPSVEPSVSDTPVDLPSDTPTEQPSSTASAPVCINSYDPACGAFYWDPAPGSNAPMNITIHASSTTLTVGETVTVTGAATDPDAEIVCHQVEWGPTYVLFGVMLRSKFGRWDTPEKKLGHVTETVSHAYDKPGTYRIAFEAISGGCPDSSTNPYTSEGTASVTVTVVAASPSPSPSVSESPSPSASPSPSP